MACRACLSAAWRLLSRRAPATRRRLAARAAAVAEAEAAAVAALRGGVVGAVEARPDGLVVRVGDAWLELCWRRGGAAVAVLETGDRLDAAAPGGASEPLVRALRERASGATLACAAVPSVRAVAALRFAGGPAGSAAVDLVVADGSAFLGAGRSVVAACGAGAPPEGSPFDEEVLDDLDAAFEAAARAATLRNMLETAAAKAEKQLESRRAAFRKQLRDAAEDKEALLRRDADLLMANAHAVDPSAGSVSLEDFETGERVDVAVEEGGAVGTAQSLYKRAGKLRRARETVAPLLEGAERDEGRLSELRAALAVAGDDELGELERRLAALGVRPDERPAAPRKKAQVKSAKKRPSSGGVPAGVKLFRAPSGAEVLCGLNSKANEAVSHKLAKPGDLWMHARGAPGSHTVLRQPGGRSAPDEDVQFAADLAAFFSKLRSAGKVPVDVTLAKHVKKVPGGKLGKVLITKERTVTGRPDDSAAAALAEPGRWKA